MATNSKVFVSPGVYTSEVDLSFVAQSVGVTTLGIAGETLKGPAFEPIFIKNYDEFQAYFGGTSPEKFVNTQIPKYEAAYIAKSYLQQSNQLFVTRILGLSGYDAGPSWSIVTKANVNPSTIEFQCASGATVDCLPVCYVPVAIPFVVPFTGCTNSEDTIQYEISFPSLIENMLTEQYENFDGSISTLDTNIKDQIFNIITDTSPTTAEATNISYFGSIWGDDYNDLVSMGLTGETNVFNVPSPSADLTDYTSPNNDAWYYALFDNTNNGLYSGFSHLCLV
jgi:hypothetical protein